MKCPMFDTWPDTETCRERRAEQKKLCAHCHEPLEDGRNAKYHIRCGIEVTRLNRKKRTERNRREIAAGIRPDRNKRADRPLCTCCNIYPRAENNRFLCTLCWEWDGTGWMSEMHRSTKHVRADMAYQNEARP